jgi:glycosyltransferase involved in cell wall biosynthesis
MSAVRVFTLATPATLPQARVLARSLKEHQPDWPHEVVVVAPEGWAAAPNEELRVSSAAELTGIDVEPLIGRYEERELAALIVPRLLKGHRERTGGPALHLPPTAWVLGGLEPMEEALKRRSVVLAPRTKADMPADGLEPTQAQLERAGRMAETVIGVDGTERAEGFLTWWGGQVERALGSLDGERSGGRPEDRGWTARMLELAPARFATAVLEDAGCNLGEWNLHEHTLDSDGDAVRVDGGGPLRFMDMEGFDPEKPFRLSERASRVRVSRSEALRGLCARYAEELKRAGWSGGSRRRDIGRRMADGTVYDQAAYSLHMLAAALGAPAWDVFEKDGAEAFAAWLEGPAPKGGAHGITRYVYYRVAQERPDVLRAYPDLDGKDGAECVAWCEAFGRGEMGIPDRYMPAGATTTQSEGPRGAHRETKAKGPSRNGSGNRARSGGDGGGGEGSPGAREGSPPAVRVTGYLQNTLGLGAAARGYAEALQAAGVKVSTESVGLHHMQAGVELGEGYGRHGFEEIESGGGKHGIEIVAVNPDELPAFVERVGESYFQGPKIGVWGWETDSIPARWERAFGMVDEIWVYSRFMAKNIGAAAPVPVVALPPPVKPPAAPAEPFRLGLPQGFLFLFIFDYLSTIQRKNPVGLIEAFKRAFEPGEGPRLLLKTINAPLRPLAEEEVLWAAHGREDIHVIDRSLSAEELGGLTAACDCYVSLHRSEGFGLTLAEAMAIGKPVIGTGYSGNLDFMGPENSFLVRCEPTKVGPDCEIYPADGEWAEPDTEHAAELMRRVYENPEEAAALGERAREDIAKQLSPEATGAAMRRRLEEREGEAGESPAVALLRLRAGIESINSRAR